MNKVLIVLLIGPFVMAGMEVWAGDAIGGSDSTANIKADVEVGGAINTETDEWETTSGSVDLGDVDNEGRRDEPVKTQRPQETEEPQANKAPKPQRRHNGRDSLFFLYLILNDR
jgi:hypothetical protein